MSPLGIVALIAGLGITGYVGYDIYKSSQTSPITNAVNTVKGVATGAISTAENLLSEDPISITNVAKDIGHGAESVGGDIETGAKDVWNWL